jgi:hypothetical protein
VRRLRSQGAAVRARALRGAERRARGGRGAEASRQGCVHLSTAVVLREGRSAQGVRAHAATNRHHPFGIESVYTGGLGSRRG